MIANKTLVIFVLISLSSCNGSIESSDQNFHLGKNPLLTDTLNRVIQHPGNISDTIQKFVVDGFPVTDKMLADFAKDNPSYILQSGKLFSYDKAWFRNDSLKQTLVIGISTDMHRSMTCLFYSNNIPEDIISRLDLNMGDGALVSLKEKRENFGGFLKQAKRINSSFFISNKGMRLGDQKLKVMEKYGQPDKQTIQGGMETDEWTFTGDMLYDGKTDLHGKPLAKESYGHRVVMYFKKEKLIAQILYNDLP